MASYAASLIVTKRDHCLISKLLSPVKCPRLVEAHRGGWEFSRGDFLKLKLSKRDRVQLDPFVENIQKTVRRVHGNNSAHSKLGQKELIYRNFQEMLKRVSRKAQKP